MTADREQRAAIKDVKDTCDRVAKIHARMLRGEDPKEVDWLIVRRLIRLLVAEWL